MQTTGTKRKSLKAPCLPNAPFCSYSLHTACTHSHIEQHIGLPCHQNTQDNQTTEHSSKNTLWGQLDARTSQHSQQNIRLLEETNNEAGRRPPETQYRAAGSPTPRFTGARTHAPSHAPCTYHISSSPYAYMYIPFDTHVGARAKCCVRCLLLEPAGSPAACYDTAAHSCFEASLLTTMRGPM